MSDIEDLLSSVWGIVLERIVSFWSFTFEVLVLALATTFSCFAGAFVGVWCPVFLVSVGTISGVSAVDVSGTVAGGATTGTSGVTESVGELAVGGVTVPPPISIFVVNSLRHVWNFTCYFISDHLIDDILKNCLWKIRIQLWKRPRL